MHVKACRICNKGPLSEIIRLGKMPLVNYFPLNEERHKNESAYPLTLCFCENCSLVQLDYVVPPKKLFQVYHYLTSASEPLILHFRALAEEFVSRRFVSPRSKILDIGANDGTLLLEFKKYGVQPLGVDPSKNAVDMAKKVGIDVICDFWSPKVAHNIRKKYGRFDIITSNNVFAHTHDVKSFLKGVRELLAPHGIFTVEFAHLLEMIVKNQFDVIYHEHVSFFSLKPLIYLFEMFDLEIFDAKKILTQGGSLRIYARHSRKKNRCAKSTSLEVIIQEERDNHITEVSTLKSFAKDVHKFRIDFRNMIADLKKKGHTIVGYGAPAKGVILLNYCGIGQSEIDYIVDSTPLKQGRFFPGSHIPVYAERKLETDKCDYVLLLAWNFQDSILAKLEPLRAKGLKVIIPFPKLRIV